MDTNSFRLSEDPSRSSVDPDFLLLTPSVDKLLKELTYAIRFRKGLIVFTGEAGTGKTTLIHRLLYSLHQHGTPVAFISEAHLEIERLYRSMLMKFGATLDSRLGSPRLALKEYLSERSRTGNTAVLIVDEAEGLSLGVLEEIRMLLNLETPREKMLSIVLVGGPLFEEMLRRPELYQFKQRITLRFKTVPFETGETHRYIRERLLAAGAPRELHVFSPDAMNAIHSYSRGVPGLANLLCEHALARALAQNIQPVPAHVVAEVARDLELAEVEIAAQPQAAIGAESDEPTEVQPLFPIPSLTEAAKPVGDAAGEWQVSQSIEAPAEIRPVTPVPGRAHTVEPVDHAECVAEVSQPAQEEPSFRLVSHPLAAAGLNETADQLQPDAIALSSETVSDPPAQPNPEIPANSPFIEPVEAGAVVEVGADPSPSAHPTMITMPRWRRTHVVPVLSRWLRTPLNPLRALRRSWSLFQALRLAALNPAERARIRASLFRWLREPFDPIRWLERSFRPTAGQSAMAQRETRTDQ